MRRLAQREDPLLGRDIVCFSNDWEGDPLSKTHLMRLLAREHRVLWINSLGNRAPRPTAYDARRLVRKLRGALKGVRELEPNLFVLSPLAIPAFGSAIARRLNRVALKLQIERAMARLRFNGRPVVWSFLPAADWVATSLRPALLVYHCVDEFSAFSDASPAVAASERRLVEASDVVIASAERLYESKRALNPNTVLVRHGVDHAHFARALDAATAIPTELEVLPRPRFGFFGLIEDWVDLGLVARVARAWPGGSVVLVGKVKADTAPLRGLPNVHLVGARPYAELPAWCKGWDVALLPFKVNELTLNANPLKAREYLAAGLPVVSTAIPEVERLGLCRIGRTPEQYEAQVAAALGQPGPSAARSRAVAGEGWEARLEEIRKHLARVVAERRGKGR